MIKMIPKPPSPVSDQATKDIWNLVQGDNEAFIGKMRGLGADKIDCIKSLRCVTSVSLDEAKEIVHHSKVWDDHRASDDAFHNIAFRALEELQRKNENEAVAS